MVTVHIHESDLANFKAATELSFLKYMPKFICIPKDSEVLEFEIEQCTELIGKYAMTKATYDYYMEKAYYKTHKPI